MTSQLEVRSLRQEEKLLSASSEAEGGAWAVVLTPAARLDCPGVGFWNAVQPLCSLGWGGKGIYFLLYY